MLHGTVSARDDCYILLILPEKTINITVHVCSNNSFTDMSPKNESCPNKSCTPLSRH